MHLAENLSSAALVVAHPDDEILWFSSIVHQVAKVIVCYLEVPGEPIWTAGRQQVASSYPLGNATFLGLTESVAFQGADWAQPKTSETGLEVSKRPNTLPGFDAEKYSSNFQTLRTRLQEELAGFRTIVTHNPWGEYGHEEHVQVYRVVSQLAGVLEFDVWYTNYCSERSYPLMLQSIDGRRSAYETLKTNPDGVRCVEALYQQHDCWTWPFEDFQYFESESYIKDEPPDSARAPGSTVPLNFIKLADHEQKRRQPRWQKRLTRYASRAQAAFKGRG